MKNIVCLSTTSFEPLPTRKQNVMSRLKNCEVLYFDPSVSIIAPLKDKTAFKKCFNFMKKGYNPQENITVYALPPILPFYNKVRFINKINQFFMSIYVKNKIRKHKFKDILLWCYSPSSVDIVDRIKKDKLIYDCIDRHSGYVGMINVDVVNKMEKELSTKSDLNFATAVGLKETLENYNKNVHLIPNGCAYELFNLADTGTFETPKELLNAKGKIFGFVGMLQECIDYDLIELLAKNRPQDTIIFIGKTLPGVDISRFSKYENVIFKGLVPQKELPAYISKFDVCLNTFKSGMLSKDVSPLKFFEYLATGKPIVSTREPLQVLDFSDCIYISKDENDFLEMCEKALSEKDDTMKNMRINHAKLCSWDERVLQMEEILNKM